MKRKSLIVFILLFSLYANAQHNSNSEKSFFESKNIFNPLSDGMGYHNYRIPSLLVTRKGTILAVMEGREDMNHDHAKNDIVLKRSTNNGDTWSKPTIIQEAGDNVVMNPVMVQALDGTIILTYIYFPKKRHSRDRSHGVKQVDTGFKGNTIERLFVIKSTDEGLSWSEPQEITSVAKSSKNTIVSICGPGVGITLTKGKFRGRVIIPMSEAILKKAKRVDYSFALYSDDNGKTWKHGKFFPPTADGNLGGNEIQMVELEGGKVLASVRSKGYRLISSSEDGAKTWSPLKKHKDLVDTGCMSPLLRYRWKTEKEAGVLIHIGVTGRPDGRKRGKSVIALSYDDGKTWSVQRPLYNQNFDYSSLVILPDGSIGMLAEYDFNGNRATIKFVKFNLSWIESKKKQLLISKKVVKPDVYFRTHPNHIIPENMVIQKFKVELKAGFVEGNDSCSFQYELIEKQGNAKLLSNDNLNKFSTSNKNTFLADWFGLNIIKVSAKNNDGMIVATTLDSIFVHFSHTQLAGGDVTKLDNSYKGNEYIAGKIENGKLVYPGMRFLPSDISKGDTLYEGTKYGAYETKEPRVLALKDGTLIASYHFQVKGKNDAPPGLTLVLTRSLDGGKTWIDDQILMQDVNGVVAYASLVEWKDQVQCYFAGGHRTHQHANAYQGVYRTMSSDKGETWSTPEFMSEMTNLITHGSDTISPSQSPSTNALFIPEMEWRGKKGDAILVPFYIDPVHFLISMDGGNSWDIFYDVEEYPEYKGELNEISWALLDNRTIYVVSRRQSKTGYKNEMLFDLEGNPTFLAQSRKNHKARRCHQGAVKIGTGYYKGRIAVASNYSGDREEATIAISESQKAEKFETKFLTSNAAWGYCHIDWNPKLNGFVLIGESEPFDKNEQVVQMDGGPDRNERYSIECFTFSPKFYETLVEADINK